MYLECLVPLLTKLAEIKYSVFAKGHHCQWHALLVARIVATLHEFIFPGTLHKDYAPQAIPLRAKHMPSLPSHAMAHQRVLRSNQMPYAQYIHEENEECA